MEDDRMFERMSVKLLEVTSGEGWTEGLAKDWRREEEYEAREDEEIKRTCSSSRATAFRSPEIFATSLRSGDESGSLSHSSNAKSKRASEESCLIGSTSFCQAVNAFRNSSGQLRVVREKSPAGEVMEGAPPSFLAPREAKKSASEGPATCTSTSVGN